MVIIEEIINDCMHVVISLTVDYHHLIFLFKKNVFLDNQINFFVIQNLCTRVTGKLWSMTSY